MLTTGMLRSWPRLVLILLFGAGFALRLHELTLQDIWWDEARNIDVALRPFFQVATAPELDIHPPIYFWLLHVWSRLTSLQTGIGPVQLAYVARFLSVAAGLACIGLVYQLTRLVGSRSKESAGATIAGLCAATLATFSPLWLAESQETRMYTVSFALLIAAAITFLKMIGVEGSKNARASSPDSSQFTIRNSTFSTYRNHILFVLLSALALLTHYNAVFILVAWYLWWAAWALKRADRWPRLATLLICGVGMTLLVLPIAPIALRQIPVYENPNLVVPGISDYLVQNWQAYMAGYAYEKSLLLGATMPWLWAMLALLIGGLILAWRSHRAEHLSFLLMWLIGGLVLYYIAVIDRGAFNVRYSSFITPALYALLGIALAGLGRIWRPLTVVGLLVVLAGFAPAVHADIYNPDAAREDVEGLTDWLRSNTGPNDVIFVDQKYPFGLYYQRYAIDPALTQTPAGDEVAPARYLFVDINTIDQRLNEWAGDAERVFWVQWYESDTDPRRAVSFLLDKEGERAGEQWFRGYSVDWWDLTPPTKFELAQEFMPINVAWPPAVQAIETALPSKPIAPGETAFIVIRWQRAGEDYDRPLKARLGLYDSEERRVAQSDKRILNDRHLMPGEWGIEEQPLNVYKLATEDDIAQGTYSVRLLVYDADTLEPLSFIDEAGNPAGVEVPLAELTIEPETMNSDLKNKE
jgi:mannosyltransferase